MFRYNTQQIKMYKEILHMFVIKNYRFRQITVCVDMGMIVSITVGSCPMLWQQWQQQTL